MLLTMDVNFRTSAFITVSNAFEISHQFSLYFPSPKEISEKYFRVTNTIFLIYLQKAITGIFNTKGEKTKFNHLLKNSESRL